MENTADEAAVSGTPLLKVTETQTTPNPDALQFVLNRSSSAKGAQSFASQEEAQQNPLAMALFALFGVENVFLKDNFVSVTKSPIVGWGQLQQEVIKIIESQVPQPATNTSETESSDLDLSPDLKEFTPEEFINFSNDQKRQIIDILFEYSIRPALAKDGGGLTLMAVDGTVVEIQYHGACGTCPSSQTGTLQYIEGLLKEHLHPELKVQSV